VRISPPQTVVPKRRQESTDQPAASITQMTEAAGNLKIWCVITTICMANPDHTITPQQM